MQAFLKTKNLKDFLFYLLLLFVLFQSVILLGTQDQPVLEKYSGNHKGYGHVIWNFPFNH